MNIQLKKGVMEIVVLSMLRRRDFYGYELVSEISKYIERSEGTIYPLLNRFKKDGLVDTYLAESHNGPPRKYYKITEAGRTEYIESVREWSDFTKAVNMLLTEGGEPYEKTYKSSAYRGFLSLNRCHIPDDTSFTGFFP